MAQFDIIRNPGKSRAEVPYLLVLQNDVMSDLHTRIVAPLKRLNSNDGKGITRIHLDMEIENISCRILLSELAAIPSSRLGGVVCNISEKRAEIISALDLIFTGF